MKEILVMIGFPGSGKTTIASNFGDDYYRVDGDSLKTGKAMTKDAEKHSDKSIIFDCTSGTKKKRAEFIAFAKTKGVPIRALWLQTSMEVSMRRNEERGKSGGSKVPNVVFYVYRKQFEEPEMEEGFSEIVLC